MAAAAPEANRRASTRREIHSRSFVNVTTSRDVDVAAAMAEAMTFVMTMSMVVATAAAAATEASAVAALDVTTPRHRIFYYDPFAVDLNGVENTTSYCRQSTLWRPLAALHSVSSVDECSCSLRPWRVARAR